MNYRLPIRSKVELARGIGELMYCLHTGQRSASDLLAEELKSHSLFLDKDIQHDVLMFVEAVQFQFVYDPWHLISPNVERSAKKLIEDLGFVLPEQACSLDLNANF